MRKISGLEKNTIFMYIISDTYSLIIIMIFIFLPSNIWWLPSSTLRLFQTTVSLKTIANSLSYFTSDWFYWLLHKIFYKCIVLSCCSFESLFVISFVLKICKISSIILIADCDYKNPLFFIFFHVVFLIELI